MRGSIFVAIVGVWLAWPIAGSAQPAQPSAPRAMVLGHIGLAEAGAGETLKGSGVEFGVAASVRPFTGAPRIALEGGFSAFVDPREDLTPTSSKEVSAQLVVARAVYTFRRSDARARPYLFGGLAVIHIDYESQCVDCVFDIDPVTGRLTSRGQITEHIEDTQTGFTLGFGVDVGVSRAIILRPEWSASSTTPGSGRNWSWGAARLGVGYRF